MKILTVYTEGEYGERHIRNIEENGPESWKIAKWMAPTALPLIIDYPEDFIR